MSGPVLPGRWGGKSHTGQSPEAMTKPEEGSLWQPEGARQAALRRGQLGQTKQAGCAKALGQLSPQLLPQDSRIPKEQVTKFSDPKESFYF